MTILDDALRIAALSSDPELIRWAYTHPKADEKVFTWCLDSEQCPTDVLDSGYRQRRAAVRKLAFCNPNVGSTWEDRLASEKSVEVFRAILQSGHSRFDSALVDCEAPMLGVAVSERMSCSPHVILNTYPQLFWRFADDEAIEHLPLGARHDLLVDPNTSDDRFARVAVHVDSDVRSIVLPLQAQLMVRLLDVAHDRLVGCGVDVQQCREHLALLASFAGDDGPDRACAKVLEDNPSLGELPGKAEYLHTNWFHAVDTATVVTYLCKNGEYIAAGNILAQCSDPWFFRYQDHHSNEQLVAVWLKWAFSEDVRAGLIKQFLECFNFDTWTGTQFDVFVDLHQQYGSKVSAVCPRPVATALAERLGGDMDLAVLLAHVPGGLRMVTEILASLDNATVTAFEMLEPRWKGSLNDLVAAARNIAA